MISESKILSVVAPTRDSVLGGMLRTHLNTHVSLHVKSALFLSHLNQNRKVLTQFV
jgi:hypothetical protein